MVWFDMDYQYRKEMEIAGSSGAGIDYQVTLTIGESITSPGVGDWHLDDNCFNFPVDMRFTSSDEVTELNYHVKDLSGVSPNRVATVVVKVADNLDTNKTIYCYYRNPTAVDGSDPDNTYILYDNCDYTLYDEGGGGGSANAYNAGWRLEKELEYARVVAGGGILTLDVDPEWGDPYEHSWAVLYKQMPDLGVNNWKCEFYANMSCFNADGSVTIISIDNVPYTQTGYPFQAQRKPPADLYRHRNQSPPPTFTAYSEAAMLYEWNWTRVRYEPDSGWRCRMDWKKNEGDAWVNKLDTTGLVHQDPGEYFTMRIGHQWDEISLSYVNISKYIDPEPAPYDIFDAEERPPSEVRYVKKYTCKPDGNMHIKIGVKWA